MPIKYIPNEITCDHCGCEVDEKEVYSIARGYMQKDLILTDTKSANVTPQPARMVKQQKVLCKQCSDKMWDYGIKS